MTSLTRIRLLIAMIAAAALQACMSVPTDTGTTSSASATAVGARTFLFSWGMFADPVFDRDVVTFNRAYSKAFGLPENTELFGYTSSRLTEPTPDRMEASITQMAAGAVDGRDVVVVMLTSHGSPDVMAVKTSPAGEVFSISAETLAAFLAPLSNDRQILILQACFSGSLIDELRAPNRIIMTAAAADRSSFGCNPDSDNTWFIKSMNRAMAQGGSWQQIFARTRALVATDETAQGVPASNPQSYVGANMRDIWTVNAL